MRRSLALFAVLLAGCEGRSPVEPQAPPPDPPYDVSRGDQPPPFKRPTPTPTPAADVLRYVVTIHVTDKERGGIVRSARVSLWRAETPAKRIVLPYSYIGWQALALLPGEWVLHVTAEGYDSSTSSIRVGHGSQDFLVKLHKPNDR